MTSEVAVLGIAATLAVAAIASLWKIVGLVLQLNAVQDEARHRLRNEVGALILESEARLTARLETLERTSIGYRRRLGEPREE